MKLDLRYLQQREALDNHPNFARAAKKINISQPGLSQSIRILEDLLAEPLDVWGGLPWVYLTNKGEWVPSLLEGLNSGELDILTCDTGFVTNPDELDILGLPLPLVK